MLNRVFYIVKKYRYIFIGLVVIGILIGSYFPAHIFYRDHYPPINLVKMGNIGLQSNGAKSTEYFQAPDNWQIVYSFSCTGSISNDVFQIGVIDTNSTTDASNTSFSADTTSNGINLKTNTGSGSQTEPSKGVYSLTVLTDPNCTWAIILSPSASNNSQANYSKDSKYIVQPNSMAIENML